MKNILKFSIITLIFPLFLVSCSADEVEDLTSANYNAQMVKTFIYDSDLVGEWKLQTMVANKEIDLNGDGEMGNNLIKESTCFENITYTFRGNKTFTIINSTLELSSVNDTDEFKCQSASTISGKWSIKDDMLTLYIRHNNQEYQEQKHLILTEDTFLLEINKIESKDYILDKGNSSAAGLSVVALEFARTSKKV